MYLRIPRRRYVEGVSTTGSDSFAHCSTSSNAWTSDETSEVDAPCGDVLAAASSLVDVTWTISYLKSSASTTVDESACPVCSAPPITYNVALWAATPDPWRGVRMFGPRSHVSAAKS